MRDNDLLIATLELGGALNPFVQAASVFLLAFLLLNLYVALLLVAGILAERKGRSPWLWFFWTMFWPFAVLVLCAVQPLPPRHPRTPRDPIVETESERAERANFEVDESAVSEATRHLRDA